MPKQTQTVVGSICLINLWTFWKLEHVVLRKKISKNRKFFFSFLKGFRKSGKKNFWKILKNFRKFFEIFFWNFFRGWARTHGKCLSLMWFCKSGKKNFEKFFEKFSKIKNFFFSLLKGTSAYAGPHYHKLYGRVTHVWGNRRGQPKRSAMQKPRSGRSPLVIRFASPSGKYEVKLF